MRRNKERKEYIEVLRKKGYKWITRSAHGEVQAHFKKPKRMLNFWESKGRKEINAMMFNELKWCDEPLYIGKERNNAANNKLEK